MSALGFTTLKDRWKPGGKMGYWLFQKGSEKPASGVESREAFSRKDVLREGRHRNNFVILL
jgi:25S rRNA (adenine2142-N1)-methyltransferase